MRERERGGKTHSYPPIHPTARLIPNATIHVLPGAIGLVQLSPIACRGECDVYADSVLVGPPVEYTGAGCAADDLWGGIGFGVGEGSRGDNCGGGEEEGGEELHVVVGRGG